MREQLECPDIVQLVRRLQSISCEKAELWYISEKRAAVVAVGAAVAHEQASSSRVLSGADRDPPLAP